MNRIKAIRDHYEPRISDDRPNYDIVDWANSAGQVARFCVLVDNVPLEAKRLLDVGCGLGDLWEYLRQRDISADYTGVDLVGKMVDRARRHHPGVMFVCGDIMAEQAAEELRQEQFDVVFCSGVLNLDLGDNNRVLPVALQRLFELAREYVVFNLLHARAAHKTDYCAYYDPQQVMKLLKTFPCGARIIDDYLPEDFTVICDLT